MCMATNAVQDEKADKNNLFWKNPSFWKSAATGITVSGGIMSATGQYVSGRAERDFYNASASALEQQAVLDANAAQRQIKYDVQHAAENVKQVRRSGRQNYANQLIAAAAGGVDFSSVSFQDVVLDSLRAEQEDINYIKTTASRQAYETQLQAELNSISANARAKQQRLSASAAYKTGKLNAFSSLLSSASSVAGMWSK